MSASTDINADKLAEFFVDKVEGVRTAISYVPPPPPYVRHDASPQLLSSFYWGSATRDDGFGCQSSALDRNSEGRRLKIGDNCTPCEKFLATPLMYTSKRLYSESQDIRGTWN